CPPPRHNFTSMPRIRSERPAFEAHYPHLIERLEREAHGDKRHRMAEAVGAATIGADGQRDGRRDPDPGS
ncbi:MAG: cytochrome c oxidase, subunit, partial [Frankiales bacterium]|nr:cytochrome c oxidase, subunit [Frankiales bacterium]